MDKLRCSKTNEHAILPNGYDERPALYILFTNQNTYAHVRQTGEDSDLLSTHGESWTCMLEGQMTEFKKKFFPKKLLKKVDVSF